MERDRQGGHREWRLHRNGGHVGEQPTFHFKYWPGASETCVEWAEAIKDHRYNRVVWCPLGDVGSLLGTCVGACRKQTMRVSPVLRSHPKLGTHLGRNAETMIQKKGYVQRHVCLLQVRSTWRDWRASRLVASESSLTATLQPCCNRRGTLTMLGAVWLYSRFHAWSMIDADADDLSAAR